MNSDPIPLPEPPSLFDLEATTAAFGGVGPAAEDGAADFAWLPWGLLWPVHDLTIDEPVPDVMDPPLVGDSSPMEQPHPVQEIPAEASPAPAPIDEPPVPVAVILDAIPEVLDLGPEPAPVAVVVEPVAPEPGAFSTAPEPAAGPVEVPVVVVHQSPPSSRIRSAAVLLLVIISLAALLATVVAIVIAAIVLALQSALG